MDEKNCRIRGFDDSSIVVTKTKNGVRIETLVKGGKTYCNLSSDKALELGETLMKALKQK